MRTWAGREQHGDYSLITSGIDPAVVTLDETHVDQLRTFVVDHFLPTMSTLMPQRLDPSEIEAVPGTAAISSKWGWDRFTNPDAKATEFTGLVFVRPNPNSWKLYILNAKDRVGAIHKKIMSDYILQVDDGEVVTAKRKTRFVFTDIAGLPPKSEDPFEELSAYDRSLKGAAFDAIYDALTADTEDIRIERVMYERPLDEVACMRIRTLLERVVRRNTIISTTADLDRRRQAERALERRERRNGRLNKAS